MAAAAAANAQNSDPIDSTASGPGKKSKDSSGTQSDDGTGDTSATGTSASPDASANAPTPVATVIVVNSAIDTTPGAAANAPPSLAIGAQAKARTLIATTGAPGRDAGTSQNTDGGTNAGSAAGNATTAADANTASNAQAAPSPAAPADAAPVAANFQQTLNQANSTPAQGDPNAPASTPTVATHGAGTTAPAEAAGSASQAGAATKAAATNLPTFGIVAANVTAATPQTATSAATGAMEPTVSLEGLPVAIASRAQAGSSQFDIRLDPPELGRIEVQLSVDSNGQVTSHITADRQDTLNLLQSQQPQLQQALEQAGLKTSDSAMQFSLRDQSFAGQQQQNQNFAQNGNNSQSNMQQIVIPDSSLSSVDTTQIYSRLNLRGGLDIRV